MYFASPLYYITIQFLEDNNYIIYESYNPGKIVGMILEIIMDNYIKDNLKKMNIIERIDLLVKLFYSLVYEKKITKNEDTLIDTLSSLVKECLIILTNFEKENKEKELISTKISEKELISNNKIDIDILLQTKFELKDELKQIIIKCCESLLSIKLFLSEISYLDNRYNFNDNLEMICKVFFHNFLKIQGELDIFIDNENSFTLNKIFYKTVYKKTKFSKRKFIKIITALEKKINVNQNFNIMMSPFFKVMCNYIENKKYLE